VDRGRGDARARRPPRRRVREAGRTVVGGGEDERGPAAFIWDAERGLRALDDVLSSVKGHAGWRLEAANGISADGRLVVGAGKNPKGASEAWLARLPER
jgi:hypothetical protein